MTWLAAHDRPLQAANGPRSRARKAAHLSSASTIVGENALDTKVGVDLDGNGSPPTVELEDVVAHGFRGFISNQAAFNLKEDVDVLVDRVTVYDTELAFRLRGPASVRVQNAVVYDVDGAVRYEDGLPGARILASTFGGDVAALRVQVAS